MLKKLSTIPILTFVMVNDPLRAIAQQAQPPAAPQPPQGYGPGPGTCGVTATVGRIGGWVLR
jgi:hypothetical protein